MTALISKFREKLTEEDGVSTVEVVLILVVLVGLVLVFKNQIMGMVETIFGHIDSSINEIY